jgi:hypothetical protein
VWQLKQLNPVFVFMSWGCTASSDAMVVASRRGGARSEVVEIKRLL